MRLATAAETPGVGAKGAASGDWNSFFIGGPSVSEDFER